MQSVMQTVTGDDADAEEKDRQYCSAVTTEATQLSGEGGDGVGSNPRRARAAARAAVEWDKNRCPCLRAFSLLFDTLLATRIGTWAHQGRYHSHDYKKE